MQALGTRLGELMDDASLFGGASDDASVYQVLTHLRDC